MAKRPSNHGAAIIELPELVQSLGQSGRSGVLSVDCVAGKALVQFRGGQVVAYSSGSRRGGALYRALVWIGLADVDAWARKGLDDVLRLPDEELARRLLAEGLINQDGLRDAVDVHVEEGFTELIGWREAQIGFEPEGRMDPWGAFQASLGTAIPASSLLMEGLRRQDELSRVAADVPQRWDLLIFDADRATSSQIDASAQALIGAWRPGRPAGAIMELSGLTPWTARQVAGRLVHEAVFRIAEAQEILVYADRSRAKEHLRTAEGLYRRALEKGAAAGRIHLALAELSERRGNEQQAAEDYLRAAESLGTQQPADGVLALRNAMRLGAEREACLRRLHQIYTDLGEADDAIDVLFQLAGFYEDHGRFDDAAAVVHEAAASEKADGVRCAQVLAGLALLAGRQDEGIVHLERAISVAQAAGREADASAARRQLLLLDPGRGELALAHASDLVGRGQGDEALKVVQRALDATQRLMTEEVEVRLRELLATLDPNDSANHEALARFYGQRKDRDSAGRQLLLLADSQEREGDLPALVETLRQVLQLGGDQGDTQARLARVCGHMGLDRQGREAWQRAVDAAIEAGDLARAAERCREALAEHGAEIALHARMATIANRSGDRAEAEARYRTAAWIARGTGRAEEAFHLLSQVQALRQEDTGIRLDLIELAIEAELPDREELVRDFTRFAAANDDLGLAITWAECRVRLAEPPAFAARAELIELLRRAGREQDELRRGRQLFDELCEHGRVEDAVALLQRLVASHSRNPDLVYQLAELQEALDDRAAAVRCYRHAVTLFQQAERLDDARRALDHLDRLQPGDKEVARARMLLDDGEAVDWSLIRQERSQARQRRLADITGAPTSRRTVTTSSVRHRAVSDSFRDVE